MKKFIFLSILATTAMSSLASTLPEVLYLCGNFNDWEYPDTEAGRGYQLTDEDKDGIYTGSFELPEQSLCQFKIITQADSPEYNPDIILGVRPEDCDVYLFKGETESRNIGTAKAGYKRGISICNWCGGTLDISVKLYKQDDKYTIGLVKLLSDTQPEIPKMDCVYLIGAFNDYKVPEGENLNGAIPLQRMNGRLPVYEGMANIPAGEASIALCYIDPETKETGYVCGDGMSYQMYSQIKGVPATMKFIFGTSENFDKEKDTLTIGNWNGGLLTVRYEIIPRILQLMWDDAPLNDFPAGGSLYMIMDTDDGQKIIQTDSDNFIQINEPTSIKSIIFSTENSANPDPSTVWGVPEGIDNRITESSTLKLAQGGQPILIDCKDYMTALIKVNRTGRDVSLNINEYSEIILFGFMTNWNFITPDNEEFYEQYKLRNEGHGLFTGSFLCPASDDASFLFYTPLSDMGLYPIGASESYEYSPISISTGEWANSGIAVGGKGMWALGDCNEDVNVDFRLDLRLCELSMKINSSGVESVDDKYDADITYFTLQGVKVENPSNGIYIKVTAKGSEKVYIR